MAQNKGNFTCTSCGQSFDTQADLRDHEESRHGSERSTKGGRSDEPARGGENWRSGDNPERNV